VLKKPICIRHFTNQTSGRNFVTAVLMPVPIHSMMIHKNKVVVCADVYTSPCSL